MQTGSLARELRYLPVQSGKITFNGGQVGYENFVVKMLTLSTKAMKTDNSR